MLSLVFALAVLPASAAASKKAPAGVYQGKGFHFTLPKAGDTAYKTRLESSEGGGEQVYVFPPALTAEKLGELSPGKYGKLGVIKVEIVQPGDGEDPGLKALEQQTIEDFQASGSKVQTTDLSVLKLPGFYARVEGKESFALFVLKGKKELFYVTAGPDDRNALDVVRTFGEGKATPAAAAPEAKPTGPVDPFAGRKLQVTDTRSKGQIEAQKARDLKQQLLQKKDQQQQQPFQSQQNPQQ